MLFSCNFLQAAKRKQLSAIESSRLDHSDHSGLVLFSLIICVTGFPLETTSAFGLNNFLKADWNKASAAMNLERLYLVMFCPKR